MEIGERDTDAGVQGTHVVPPAVRQQQCLAGIEDKGACASKAVQRMLVQIGLFDINIAEYRDLIVQQVLLAR